MAALHKIDDLLDAIASIMRLAATTLLGVIVALQTLNIALRFVQIREFTFVMPWSAVLFVWVTFLGFFVISRMRRDVTLDFVVARLGRAGDVAARALADVVIILVAVAIVSQAGRILELQGGTLEMVGLPRWVMSFPLFVSSALILVDAVVDAVFLVGGQARRAPQVR
jgi:TRAP-type C4-dicarboxylate transport system permease small subunit